VSSISTQRDALDEPRRRLERLLLRLEVRRVAAREVHALDGAAHGGLDCVQLRHRPVLVLLALDQQQWAGDPIQEVLDAPVRELGVKPDVVPAVERGVGVTVVAGHALAQSPAFVDAPGRPDLSEAHRLDEHVRRHRDDRAHGMRSGVDERDRGTVAVADEDWPLDLERAEQLGQYLQRLLMHEPRRTRSRRRVRVAVAEARVRHHARSGRLGQVRMELAPQAHGA
jgi:hypothetical protein